MEDFDSIIKDIQKVMAKHGVEMRIKSELTFVKVDGEDKKVNKEAKRIRE